MKIFVGAGNRREMDPDKLRVPVPEYLEIVVEDFVGFIEKFASNISKGGVFVATDKPLAEGTALAVLFRLEDDYTLIRGQGTVAWVRRQHLGPGREQGMGVRFDWLDEDSQKLINKIVSTYIKEGGKPFRLESHPGGTGRQQAVPVPVQPSTVPEVAPPAPVEQASDSGSLSSLIPDTEEASPAGQSAEGTSQQSGVRDSGGAVDSQVALASVDDRDSSGERHGLASLSADRKLAPGMEGQSRADSPAPRVMEERRALQVSLSNTGTLRAADRPEQVDPGEASTAPPRVSLSSTGTFRSSSAVDPRSVDPNVASSSGLVDPPAEDLPQPALSSSVVQPGAATSPENAPLDELADPGAGFGSSQSGYQQPADDSYLSDGSLLQDPSLDAALSDAGDFESGLNDPVGPGAGFPESVPPTKELSESDFDGLDFAMLVKKANEQEAQAEAEGLERPSSLSHDSPRASDAQPAIDVPELDTPTPFSDFSDGDLVEDVEYSIDLGGTGDIDPPRVEESRPQTPIPKTPIPKPSSMVYTSTPPVDVGSIDIRSTGPLPVDRDSAFLHTGGYTSLPSPAERQRAANGGASKLMLAVALVALAVAVYFGARFAISQTGLGGRVKVEEIRLEETDQVLDNESSATLLSLMQGEAQGPVVLREDDRPMAKLTRIENITWTQDKGDTVVVIWADGAFTPTSTGYLHLTDPPRAVVKLLGAEVPYEPAEIAIDSPYVKQVRLGFHIGRRFNEIHIVADLASDETLLKRIELKGDQLHIRFGS